MSKAPNVIWREMKTPAVIKQIASNHSAYKDTDNNLSVENVLNCYKLDAVNNEHYASPYDIPVIARYTFRDNCMNLLILKFNEGGHAISVIKHRNDKIYVYDPNLGVMSVEPSVLVELFDAIINMYENEWHMRIIEGDIISVQ